MLLRLHRDLLRRAQSGPHFMRRPATAMRGFENEGDGGGGDAADGGAAGGSGAGGAQGEDKTLAHITLDPYYFPEELYTERDRK